MFIIADLGLGAMHRYWRRQAAANNQATYNSESETDEYGF